MKIAINKKFLNLKNIESIYKENIQLNQVKLWAKDIDSYLFRKVGKI